jgi:hypothetical protein
MSLLGTFFSTLQPKFHSVSVQLGRKHMRCWDESVSDMDEVQHGFHSELKNFMITWILEPICIANKWRPPALIFTFSTP